jgi:hypothetical protein
MLTFTLPVRMIAYSRAVFAIDAGLDIYRRGPSMAGSAVADCATITPQPITGMRPLHLSTVGTNCAVLAGAAAEWSGSGQAPTLNPAGDCVVCAVKRQQLQRSWICAEHK